MPPDCGSYVLRKANPLGSELEFPKRSSHRPHSKGRRDRQISPGDPASPLPASTWPPGYSSMKSPAGLISAGLELQRPQLAGGRPPRDSTQSRAARSLIHQVQRRPFKPPSSTNVQSPVRRIRQSPDGQVQPLLHGFPGAIMKAPGSPAAPFYTFSTLTLRNQPTIGRYLMGKVHFLDRNLSINPHASWRRKTERQRSTIAVPVKGPIHAP